MSCNVGRRQDLDLTLQWLCSATTALIQPLTQKPPYTMGATLKKQKKKGGGYIQRSFTAKLCPQLCMSSQFYKFWVYHPEFSFGNISK